MTQEQTASQPVRAAALICEYNPFHNGHAAQLAMLRRAYPDAAILCIQSGSFVQRGDAAIFPAPLRAHAALLHGADAVFSLPAAYSLAPAERFAAAGVESAAHLGAEVLAFGAETPQLDRLCTVSEHLHSEAFEAALQKSLRQSPSLGYPARRSAVSLLVGRRRIALFGGGIPEKPCEKETKTYWLTLPGGFSLPLGIAITGIYEYDTRDEILQEASVQQSLLGQIQTRAQRDMIAGTILDSRCRIQTADGCIRLRATLRCEEMIARMQPANLKEAIE